MTAALTKLNTSMVTIEEVTTFDIYEEDYDEALLEPEEENKDVLVFIPHIYIQYSFHFEPMALMIILRKGERMGHC